MTRYLKNAGYRYVTGNDLQDKQFTLIGVSYSYSEDVSTIGNVVLDRVETFMLFLKDIDIVRLKTTLESIVNSASEAGVLITSSEFSSERTELGYNINITFEIKG